MKFQIKVTKAARIPEILAHNLSDTPPFVPTTLTKKEATDTFIAKPTRVTKKNWIVSLNDFPFESSSNVQNLLIRNFIEVAIINEKALNIVK